MAAEELNAIAKSIVADHKGVLAADESTGTIKKRFDSIGAESTEESRRAYRNLLFTTTGCEDYIGGVILYDETIRQAADDGTPFPKLLAGKGIVPGIKVDTGAQDLAGHPNEKVTEGLDGLRARFAEYHALGARFSKWRAVITIGDGIPTDACLHVNAHALARYARRLSSVDGVEIDLSRFSIVPELSSAARMPLPGATSARAMSSRLLPISPPRSLASSGLSRLQNAVSILFGRR